MRSNAKVADLTYTWKLLNFLNLYRLVLACLFVSVALFNIEAPPLGQHSPSLFLVASGIYLLFSLVAGLSIKRRWPMFSLQVYSHLTVDFIIIIMLMHASGGSGSGIGMLLILPVAAGSVFTQRNQAAFPAIATLLVLLEQILTELEGIPNSTFTPAALLGITLFAASIVTQLLFARIRASEALAAQRGVDLANLSQLNEQIVQQMRSGVLVVDAQTKIHLINQAAWYLLGMPSLGMKPSLKSVSPQLCGLLRQWREQPDKHIEPFQAKATYPKVVPRFSTLGEDNNSCLIFVEDSSALAQQAQQMKLASLGRLTASIAHEIRNPLAAISHAGQLLAESETLADTDKRLTQIVCDNCTRVNTIIENILQLSRKDQSFQVETELCEWMQCFTEEFCLQNTIHVEQIHLDIKPADTLVKFDHAQMQQVLWNICQNGLHHSHEQGNPKLVIRGGLNRDNAGPYLEVIDHGSGVCAEVAEHIFEPFYTTEPGGTGLGLYIARELCECNRANLEYFAVPEGGSCFRITFPNPQRQVA